jgi:hypothetical protein
MVLSSVIYININIVVNKYITCYYIIFIGVVFISLIIKYYANFMKTYNQMFEVVLGRKRI